MSNVDCYARLQKGAVGDSQMWRWSCGKLGTLKLTCWQLIDKDIENKAIVTFELYVQINVCIKCFESNSDFFYQAGSLNHPYFSPNYCHIYHI